MSALGQKRTSRLVGGMSALPPKADIGTQREMSALCQKQTFCAAARNGCLHLHKGTKSGDRLAHAVPYTDRFCGSFACRCNPLCCGRRCCGCQHETRDLAAMIHAWHLWNAHLEAGRLALASAGKFIRASL